jgi:hypothetical protein
MTHEDAGHYSAKHPAGSSPDPAIAAALNERENDGQVTCAGAFGIAEDLGVTASAVGDTADLLEYRIIRCQLGLFGFAPEKKIVRPADTVPDALREHLEAAAGAGHLDCASSWEIAKELGLEKMAVSAACERLGIRITECQLGAF